MWMERLKAFGWVLAALVIAWWFFRHENSGGIVSDGGGMSGQVDSPELAASEFHGRCRKAESYALEVQSRLTAFQSRFQCEEALLLDQAFLEPSGALALSPLREQWYTVRSDHLQYLERHRIYLTMLRSAKTETRPERIKELFSLPDKANASSEELDRAISENTRKLPVFTEVGHQLMAVKRAQEAAAAGKREREAKR